MPKISALPPMSSAAADDEAPIVDDSVATTKKFTLTVLKEWLQSLTAWISPAMWTNPYKFSVYKTSSTTLSSGVNTKISYDNENFDTNNNFDAVTNFRYTAPVSGFYYIYFQAGMGSAGLGTGEFAQVFMYKNGVSFRQSGRHQGSGDSDDIPAPHIAGLIQLTAGDYIEGYAVINGSSSRALLGGNNITFITGHLVSLT